MHPPVLPQEGLQHWLLLQQLFFTSRREAKRSSWPEARHLIQPATIKRAVPAAAVQAPPYTTKIMVKKRKVTRYLRMAVIAPAAVNSPFLILLLVNQRQTSPHTQRGNPSRRIGNLEGHQHLKSRETQRGPHIERIQRSRKSVPVADRNHLQ